MADFATTGTMVRRAQAGDRTAMEDLFARYLPRVRRIVASRLGRPVAELHEVDDLVQESMLDAVRALDRLELKSEGAFCHWLATIVGNNVRDAARRRRTGGAAAPLHESIFAGDETSPSQVAQRRESEAAIERAMLQLGERYREVINLRSFCGMSYREIAEHMRLPSENTANVLFLRARKRLEQLLQ